MDIASRISPATFALAVICFFMPFFSVSCEGRPVCKITGMHLVVGANAEDMLVDKRPSKKAPPPPSVPEPLAVAALACAIAGALAGIPVFRRSGGRVAILATLGTLAWFWLKPSLGEPKPPDAAFRAEIIHVGIVLGAMGVVLTGASLAGAGRRFAAQVPLAGLGASLLTWLILRANLGWVGSLFREAPSNAEGSNGPDPSFTVDVEVGILGALVFLVASGVLHLAIRSAPQPPRGAAEAATATGPSV